MTSTEPTTTITGERADLLASLSKHRHFLRFPARELTDEQARTQSTVSELTVGGLIKHVTEIENRWAQFIVSGPAAMQDSHDAAAWERHAQTFRMGPEDTLAGLLADYDRVAARTDDLVRTLPDLDAAQPLPVAPWFEPGARWSARRVLLHIVAETAQHAGHADIVREALDGAKSMG